MARQANTVAFSNAKSRSRGSVRSAKPTKKKGLISSFEDRRRERTKAKADRLFTKQFAFSTSSDASQAEGAPRPALYKGKMGSKHRKSTRMQQSSSADRPSAKINPAGWLSALPITARSLRITTAFLCIFLVCAFLYTPAQQYYQALRDRDQLAAEYSMIEDRNTALDVQNDILASNAGMEDAVRQKYGYIKQGEETAVVTGLSEDTTNSLRNSESIEPAVLSSSVKAPEEWYTPMLDAFFGIE